MTTAVEKALRPKAEPYTLTLPVEPLARALHNALLFAANDLTLPMISAVRIEWDGTALAIVATDRYRLSVEKVAPDDKIDHGDIAPFDFLLSRTDAKYLQTAVKGARFGYAEIVTTDTQHVEFRLATIGQTLRYQPVPATFPPYQRLIDDLGEPIPTDRVGFNPQFLADLAKVLTGRNVGRRKAVDQVVVKLYKQADKPTTCIDFTDGPLVLLMALKLPDAS